MTRNSITARAAHFIFSLALMFTFILGSEPNHVNYVERNNIGLGKTAGQLDDPLLDRAKGYLLHGKVKSAVSNYGNFISWDEHPAALWGKYTYLPHVGFLCGVPGHVYSSEFEDWIGETPEETASGDTIQIWSSADAYTDWWNEGPNYSGVLFDTHDDRGTVGVEKSAGQIDGEHQWYLDEGNLYISVPYSGENVVDPHYSNAMIGLIRPWALRPKLLERLIDYDIYDYGSDGLPWSSDDDYVYYGANAAESWFARTSQSYNTDWQPVTRSRQYTHSTDFTAGDLFGSTPFTDSGDTYPLLAHSDYGNTWPICQDQDIQNCEDFGQPFWPGWWSEDYMGEDTLFLNEHPECRTGSDGYGTRSDKDCWQSVPGRAISDTDVYMEFDDRWTHRGNRVLDNEYEATGYPMGLRVMAEAHSYGVAYAEDILFVTVKVRNESGHWQAFTRLADGTKEYRYECTNNRYNTQATCVASGSDWLPIRGDAMMMPDGTRLNGSAGFDYKGMSMGFYMDADAASADIYGNFGVHTNEDDFMEYVDCATYRTSPTSAKYFPEGCPPSPDGSGDSLRISMALIYDYDGVSNAATELGVVATQLLDSPLATKQIDLDGDGIIDLYPGDPLKMTDWHWFDWYNRPGVHHREGNNDCCAGSPSREQALNKEEMLYKVMSGDTTNLTPDEALWFFHADDPGQDHEHPTFTPHFDSVDGIKETVFFQDDPDGLDCVHIMSCGPFDVDVGEEVSFSFCIIFGEIKYLGEGEVEYQDLIDNAKFAQLMYNSHYQGFIAPDAPEVSYEADHGKVTLSWSGDDLEKSKDVLSGYTDFEGYKIYRSADGGITWGTPEDKIYDNENIFVGWRPYTHTVGDETFIAQFDLSAAADSNFCVYQDCAKDSLRRGRGISGPDPKAPWFNLGYNTGLDVGEINEGLWSADSSIHFYTGVIDSVVNGETLSMSMYYFADYNVQDGKQYVYSVVAYDMGLPVPVDTNWVDNGDGTFTQQLIENNTNPDGYAPAGYQYIENSRGTTEEDPNFVIITPGYRLNTGSLSNIKVVPNPYIVRSDFTETEYKKRLRFTNLPEGFKISIFTITGELVNSYKHETDLKYDANNVPVLGGNAVWDLRTVNNQEIAPGLYIYTVESGDLTPHIGKFAVVR